MKSTSVTMFIENLRIIATQYQISTAINDPEVNTIPAARLLKPDRFVELGQRHSLALFSILRELF